MPGDRLGLGADEAGYALKDYLYRILSESDDEYEVTDYGVDSASDTTPYPSTGLRVASRLALHRTSGRRSWAFSASRSACHRQSSAAPWPCRYR
jgi:hypothetical protein